jgi:threonine dehydrogenase-like Zn-dependent dehydrogenase
VCLVGVSSAGHTIPLDVGDVNRRLVLENQAIFGSVNANRAHFRTAADVLASADRAWLARLLTRRVGLEDWADALRHRPDDVKVVIELDTAS